MTTDAEALRALYEQYVNPDGDVNLHWRAAGFYAGTGVQQSWLDFQAGHAAAKAETSPKPPACAADDGWQPIETAPEDGRVLLLGYWNSHGNWRTLRGEWHSQEFIDEYAEDPDMHTPGWYEVSAEADDETGCWRTNPTHWRPLPKPPTDKGAPDA